MSHPIALKKEESTLAPFAQCGIIAPSFGTIVVEHGVETIPPFFTSLTAPHAPNMENTTPYNVPRLYDIAYGWRDFRAECNFLIGQYQQVCGNSPTSAVELACGTGNHARMLAAIGVKTVGLDSNETMVAYARSQPGGDDPDVAWQVGDMRGFTLPTPVDLAFCLMDSLSHLLTLDEMVAHLGAVAQNVTEGGVYILDQSHPRDVFGHPDPGTPAEWESEDEDGDIVVETVWGAEEDPFDATTQIGTLTVTMTAYQDGTEIQQVQTVVPSRLWLAGEMEAIIRLSGHWHLVARYGAMDAAVPWQNEAPATRMVTVLQKVQ
jgi:SAM-dependent methyltransferase